MGIKPADSFDQDTYEILKLRGGVDTFKNVCFHHEHVLLKRYADRQTRCCDPFRKHQTRSKKRKTLGKDNF